MDTQTLAKELRDHAKELEQMADDLRKRPTPAQLDRQAAHVRKAADALAARIGRPRGKTTP